MPQSLRFKPLALVVFCFFATLIGCTFATRNRVVQRATSPDEDVTALLVDRYYHSARVADEFFLVVIPRNQDADQVIGSRHIGDKSALVATWAGKVQLQWQSNNTLLVICDSCGLKAIDIEKRLDRLGNINVVYLGFPKHTAYS